MQQDLAPRFVGASQSGKATDSLEDLLHVDSSHSLNQQPSATSSIAHVPLPGSQDSLTSGHPEPSSSHESDAQSQHSRGSAHKVTASKVRIAEERDEHDDKPRQKYAAFVEDDEGPEPSPLWYRSQTFSHRYGPSNRQEPLLSPPLRTKTFPAELPSRNVKSAHQSIDNPLQRTSFEYARTSQTASPSKLKGRGLLEPARRLLSLQDTSGRDENRSKHITFGKQPVVDDRLPGDGAGFDDRSEGLVHTQHAPNHQHPQDTRKGAESDAISPISDPLRPAKNQEHTPSTLPLVIIDAKDGRSKPSDPENMRIRRRRTGDPNEAARGRAIIPNKTRKKRIRRSISPSNVPVYSYSHLVDRLAAHMPQLINVRGPDCREPSSGDIFCYDSLQSGGLPRLLDFISLRRERQDFVRPLMRIRDLKPDRVRNVRSRYILIEDLSPRIIDYVGSTFWLNPEFFEEHLNRSGYRAESYGDPTPSTWNTNATPKDYASVRWFRPVRRARIKPLLDSERDALLLSRNNNTTGILNWFSSSSEGRYDNTVRLTTNIYRKEWPIVSDPDQMILEDDDTTFPVAWEEKVTIQVSQVPGRPPVFIILLDPLPTLDLTSQSLPRTKKSKIARSPLVPFLQAYSRAPMGPKLGLVDVFDGNPLEENTIRMLGDNLASTNCTRKDLTSWLESVHGVQPDNADMDIVTGLLWIIHRDVLGFLYFVTTVLEDIGLSATDDYIIQKRLTHWRNLITRFQTELPAMRSSIQSFYEFLRQFQPLGQAKGFIERTLHDIDELIVQNEKSYAALRADMALLESKRGIDQAESVGKLTELGFIFIPISCVAALFSMQIQPLSDPAPLYSFVIAAILTVGVIFAIRLGIRSTMITDYQRETSRRIRLYMELAPGSPIPTRTFIFYILRDRSLYVAVLKKFWGPLSRLLLALLVLGVAMLPILMLWTRNKNLDHGFKSTLTVLIFSVGAAIIYPFVKESLKDLFSTVSYSREGHHLRRLRLHGLWGSAEIETASDYASEMSEDENSQPVKHPRRQRLVDFAKWITGMRSRRHPDAESTDILTESRSAQNRSPRPRDPSPPQPLRPKVVNREKTGVINRWRNDIDPADDDKIIPLNDLDITTAADVPSSVPQPTEPDGKLDSTPAAKPLATESTVVIPRSSAQSIYEGRPKPTVVEMRREPSKDRNSVAESQHSLRPTLSNTTRVSKRDEVQQESYPPSIGPSQHSANPNHENDDSALQVEHLAHVPVVIMGPRHDEASLDHSRRSVYDHYISARTRAKPAPPPPPPPPPPRPSHASHMSYPHPLPSPPPQHPNREAVIQRDTFSSNDNMPTICDSCESKGFGCSGERPSCYHCEVNDLNCTYTLWYDE